MCNDFQGEALLLWHVALGNRMYPATDHVVARLKCPFRRKVEMSLWIRLQPFRNMTLGITT
ncbi:hypothetical protein, partial [Sinorhizobium americanum]|uniref:hypothetical protein n=1 Tax=Sinorhizobium americanum TaxID=194963 RepID=UPI001A9F8463